VIHPSVRETIRFSGISFGLEIHHDADLPARSGLGSSSSFTVGLLNALCALKGQMASKEQLAKDAIYIEQEMIKENVGSQDQTMAAFGGFRLIKFQNGNDIEVKPVTVKQDRISDLNNHLMLFFTGFSRMASEIAEEQIKNTPKKANELRKMFGLVSEAVSILNSSNGSLLDFGKLLHETWCLKRTLTDKISNSNIDEIYENARSAGAIGGKLLGAGGGGFLIVFAEPKYQQAIKEKLNKLLLVPFQFESTGSRIIFYQPENEYRDR
jgi:D-glycero-alpha-D-manno-heptose-7-phosphate kinase